MRPKKTTDFQDTLGDIREWHRRREDFLAAEGNLTRQMKSILRRIIAHHKNLDMSKPKDRAIASGFLDPAFNRIRKRGKFFKGDAEGLVKDTGPVELVRSGDDDELIYWLGVMSIGPMAVALPFVKDPRMEAEKMLIGLAKELPVAEWARTIRGFGVDNGVGLGQIVGEAGDLGRFDKKGQLWKRMGLAVINGERQRKVKDKEMAALHGYSPRRRSVMFSLGDSMIRAQGTYVPVYYREKERQLAIHPELLDKKGGKGHIHNRARRYMEKMMLRDLWQVWTGRKPIDYVPHGDAWPALHQNADKAGDAVAGQAD